jgi:hypothetical protein
VENVLLLCGSGAKAWLFSTCCCVYTLLNIVLFLWIILFDIQFDYQYYSKDRITPLFIGNDELLALSYDGFYSRMLSKVPHIAKVAPTPSDSLQLILVEENRSEIDLSPKYFKSQMMRLLNKGLKTIVICVVANESPLVYLGTQPAKVTISDNPRSKRRLELLLIYYELIIY